MQARDGQQSSAPASHSGQPRDLWVESVLIAGAALVFAWVLVLRWVVPGISIMTHGPLVGAVTADSAKVFVRTSISSEVTIVYGTEAALPSVLESVATTTLASADFTTHIRLDGLTPATTYYYNVIVDGTPQLTGGFPSFTTFPSEGSVRDFTFVILTDFAVPWARLPYVPVFRTVDRERPAFVLLGGDFDHSDPSGKTVHEARIAEEWMFKRLYSPSIKMQQDFVDLILRRYALAHVWDDHDYGVNDGDATYPFRAESLAVLTEYFPVYPVTQYGCWQSFHYAQADFFMLDSRSQRSPNKDPDGPDKSMLDAEKLGANSQVQWLKDGLRRSTARWKFVLSPSVFNPTLKKNDSWADFARERNDLLAFIAENKIAGVVVLSGDAHFGGIDSGQNSGLPEMLPPAANLAWYVGSTAPTLGTWSEGMYFTSGQDSHGYGLIRVLTNPDQVELQVKDELGNIKISYVVR